MLWLGVADNTSSSDNDDILMNDTINTMNFNQLTLNDGNNNTQQQCPICQPSSSSSSLCDRSYRISPLHYDMSDGLILQVIGQKRIILFSPSQYHCMKPHDINTPYDRQSTINCIHHPHEDQFFDYINHSHGYQYTLKEGDLLYISYGWWHHIESDGTSMSVTYRWNRHEPVIKQIQQTYTLFSQSLVMNAAKNIYKQQVIQDNRLPDVVEQLLVIRNS